MPNKKKVTMKDIAEDSGMSVAAVSMILNKRENVSFSAETVEKVMASAKKLGYGVKTSKAEAQVVGSRFRNMVVVFCPNITNPYYSTIAQAVDQVAHQKGYRTMVVTTFRDPELEKELILDAIQMNAAGIIFTMMPDDPGFLEKMSQQISVIVIGDKAMSMDISVIETNNYTAGVLMAEHLYELGHRYIAFLTTTIGTKLALAMRHQRLKAIQETYQKLAMNEPYEIIVKEKKITPSLERKNIFLEHGVGYNLCKECLEDRNLSRITAFIGNNDMVSYGIMDAILKKGYEIPGDFSVCGFDNDFASSFLPISLTTIEQYMEDKGKKAFEMLYQKIHGENIFLNDQKSIMRIEYKSQLIVRDSTNVARKGLPH